MTVAETLPLATLVRALARRRVRKEPWVPIAVAVLAALAILLAGVLGLWMWKAWGPREGYRDLSSLKALSLVQAELGDLPVSPLMQIAPRLWARVGALPEAPPLAMARATPLMVSAGAGAIKKTQRLLVSPSWFEVTGLAPRLGRRPLPDSSEVLIREHLAAAWFGDAASAIGQSLALDSGALLDIVGIYANDVDEPSAALHHEPPFDLLQVVDPAQSLNAFGFADASPGEASVLVRWSANEQELARRLSSMLGEIDPRSRDWRLLIRPLGELLQARERQQLPALAGLSLLVTLAAVLGGWLLLTARFSSRLGSAAVLAAIGIDERTRTGADRHELALVLGLAAALAAGGGLSLLAAAGTLPELGSMPIAGLGVAVGAALLTWLLLASAYAPVARIAATANSAMLSGPRVTGTQRAPRWLLQAVQGLQLLLALAILAPALQGLHQSLRAQAALAAIDLDGLTELRLQPAEPVAAKHLIETIEGLRSELASAGVSDPLAAASSSVLELRTVNLFRAFRGMRPTGTEQVSSDPATGTVIVRRESAEDGTQPAQLDYQVALVAAEAQWLARAGFKLRAGRVYGNEETAVVASQNAYARLYPDSVGLDVPLPTYSDAAADPVWHRGMRVVGVIDSPRLLTRAGVGSRFNPDVFIPPVFLSFSTLRAFDRKLDEAYLLVGDGAWDETKAALLRAALPPGWSLTAVEVRAEAHRRLREHWLATAVMLAVGLTLAASLVLATSAVFGLLVGQRAREIAIRRVLGGSVAGLRWLTLRREYLPAALLMFAAAGLWQLVSLLPGAFAGGVDSSALGVFPAALVIGLAALAGALWAIHEALGEAPAEVLRRD